jgi:CRP-like cAMP-binding protein
MIRALDRSTIAGATLFEGLDAKALDDIANSANATRLAAGATLFEQDDEATAFYMMIAGRVKIAQTTPEGHQVVIRYIGPRDMFGAVPLFTRSAYPASAVAVVDSFAARWDSATTHRLMDRYPRLVANALKIVGLRLQELQNRYRELATERVEQRVARAILRLVRQSGKQVEDGVQIEFPLSRQDIAEMTGTTLHTVSRLLSSWEQSGLLDGGRMRIVLRKPGALLAIAEDLRPQGVRPAE